MSLEQIEEAKSDIDDCQEFAVNDQPLFLNKAYFKPFLAQKEGEGMSIRKGVLKDAKGFLTEPYSQDEEQFYR